MAVKKIGNTYYPAVAAIGSTGEPLSDSSSSGGLGIPAHNYIANTYTGSNLTEVVYKTGGAAGTVVATLTLTYDGSGNLLTVTRS